jgi:hypothetical protein
MGRPFSELSSPRKCSRLTRAVILASEILILSISHAVPAWTEERIALVVGNTQYRSVNALTNPANDAGDMAASLTRLGFTVTHLDDLDFDGFRRALIAFGNAAQTADQAVIYFAGHGVEIDGKNWLIPVDAELKSEIDVYAEAINLETLIDISVMPKVVGLVVLDACRNNPFTAARARTPSGASAPANHANKSAGGGAATLPAKNPTDGASRGLAPVEVSDNVLVAFAAAAGTVASDGSGRNSPYSGSLLRHVETPGLEINYLFRVVHDDVIKETRYQEPALYGTLSKEEIYLRQGDGPSVSSADDGVDPEQLAWQFVRVTNDIATLRRFAERFPASPHEGEVTDRIAQLEGAENLAWTIVERQNSISAYRAFLDLYPYSDRLGQARATLASLETSSSSQPVEAVDLPKPPASRYQSASEARRAGRNSPSVESAWDVLKWSHDQNLLTGFAEQYPSLRSRRLPPGSEFLLPPVNATDWMLSTAKDEDVNRCFGGQSEACVKAVDKYPDYVQLRFQLCRTAGNPDGCMADAVEDARQRGYLVSRFTRSEIEKARNKEYRRIAERVRDNVENIVTDVIGNAVSNSVNRAVEAATAVAAGTAAAAAAGVATRYASPIPVSPQPTFLAAGAPALPRTPLPSGSGKWNVRLTSLRTALPSPAVTPGAAPTAPASRISARPPGNGVVIVPAPAVTPGATGNAAAGAASRASTAAATAAGAAASGRAASTAAATASAAAASHAASRAASVASTAAGRAASSTASSVAGRAASTAASNAAGRAASHAAGRAASNAASKAAAAAAAQAAANAASRIASDIRLKQDIVRLDRLPNGLPLYRYRYIGDATFYVGVMAQDVAKRVPAAVVRGRDGFFQVDYGLLGLRLQTLADWARQHVNDAVRSTQ